MAIAGLSQPNAVSVQVVDVETNRGIPRIGVELLGLGSGITDSDGIVRIPVPEGTKVLELQPPQGFKVLTPPGPIQPVPSSDEVLVKFWLDVGALKVLQAQIDQLSNQQKALETSLSTVEREREFLQQQLDSLEGRSGIAMDSLQKEIIAQVAVIDSLSKKLTQVKADISSTKLQIYEDISHNYNTFLNAILNFSQGLKTVSYAFINAQELEAFNGYILALNEARDEMHEYHDSYIETAGQYWSRATAQELEKMYDLALQEAYGDIILPLNDLLLKEIRSAWAKEKNRNIAQRNAKKPTKEAKKNLDEALDRLQIQAKKVLDLLESG